MTPNLAPSLQLVYPERWRVMGQIILRLICLKAQGNELTSMIELAREAQVEGEVGD